MRQMHSIYSLFVTLDLHFNNCIFFARTVWIYKHFDVASAEIDGIKYKLEWSKEHV